MQQDCDRKELAERARRLSQGFRAHPLIYNSSVTIRGEVDNRLALNSEGSKLQFGRGTWRIAIQASTIADDGMELWQSAAFDAHSPEGLPGDEEVMRAVDQVIEEVLALREAPDSRTLYRSGYSAQSRQRRFLPRDFRPSHRRPSPKGRR